jgi:hypothetical protein
MMLKSSPTKTGKAIHTRDLGAGLYARSSDGIHFCLLQRSPPRKTLFSKCYTATSKLKALCSYLMRHALLRLLPDAGNYG